MLKAYFDESGSSSGKRGIFTLCGLVGPEDAWRSFEKQWDALLKNPCRYPPETKNIECACRPLKYLHAQKMEGLGKRPFRRIGQLNRDHLIQGSITAILTSGVISVGSGIDLDAYGRLDEHIKNVIGTPYELCLQHVVMQSSSYGKMFIGASTEDIAYTFERHPSFELLLREMYSKMLDEGLGRKYRMGTIEFASKHEFMPLQGADRVAYEVQKERIEHQHRPEWKRLNSGGRTVLGKYFDQRGLTMLIEEVRLSGKL